MPQLPCFVCDGGNQSVYFCFERRSIVLQIVRPDTVATALELTTQVAIHLLRLNASRDDRAREARTGANEGMTQQQRVQNPDSKDSFQNAIERSRADNDTSVFSFLPMVQICPCQCIPLAELNYYGAQNKSIHFGFHRRTRSKGVET